MLSLLKALLAQLRKNSDDIADTYFNYCKSDQNIQGKVTKYIFKSAKNTNRWTIPCYYCILNTPPRTHTELHAPTQNSHTSPHPLRRTHSHPHSLIPIRFHPHSTTSTHFHSHSTTCTHFHPHSTTCTHFHSHTRTQPHATQDPPTRNPHQPIPTPSTHTRPHAHTTARPPPAPTSAPLPVGMPERLHKA